MDIKKHPRIWIGRERCGGKPCLRGTRFRVIDVLGNLAAGESRGDIIESYGIEDEDITAALEFAQALVEESTGQLLRDTDLESLFEVGQRRQ